MLLVRRGLTLFESPVKWAPHLPSRTGTFIKTNRVQDDKLQKEASKVPFTESGVQNIRFIEETRVFLMLGKVEITFDHHISKISWLQMWDVGRHCSRLFLIATQRALSGVLTLITTRMFTHTCSLKIFKLSATKNQYHSRTRHIM